MVRKLSNDSTKSSGMICKFGARIPPDICDVANSTGLHTGSLTEEQQRAFLDFRSTDRSVFERAFPSIKIIKFVRHRAEPERLKTKPPTGI
jgi:hypothetical protein